MASSRPAKAARRPAVILLLLASMCCGAAVPIASHAESSGDLAELSLEQLGNIEVVSVLRRAERLSDTPASVYVITAEDIHRSGATSLAEALRLAPNLQVARADAVQYAITARGFNSIIENKLLVMIDGRTVYSPLFSGVFWEAQDVRLTDVERIEVVSGPGGTPWGTNAVNGVINVITRSAKDTPRAQLNAGAGDRDHIAGAGWAAPLPHGGAVRVFALATSRDHTDRELDGAAVRDRATRTQGGFRADWDADGRAVLVEGELYRGDIEQVPGVRRITGAYMLGRWSVDHPDGRSTRVQAYYDRTGRDQPAAIDDALQTIDVEAQKSIRPFAHHDVLYGAGYRYQADRLNDLSAAFALLPDDRDLRYVNAFVEDVWAPGGTVEVTPGLKLEHNDYTGLELLPSVRLSWKPVPAHLVWAAVSRAVRAPARVDRDYYSPAAPPHVFLNGGPRFRSEVANVAELGLRGQAMPTLSYSITGYFAGYDRLRSLELRTPAPEFANGLRADVVGLEAWVRWRVVDEVRIDAGTTQLLQHRWHAPGSTDVLGTASLGNDPPQWWTARTSIDLPFALEFDAALREVGPLPSPHVPSYVAVDTRLGWRARSWAEISVALQNAFDAGHPEWGTASARAEFPRSAFVRVDLRP